MTTVKDKNSIDEDDSWWKHLLAGGMAGIVSRTCTAPLDRIKIRVQVTGNSVFAFQGIRNMYREEGIRSMWRGNGVNITKVAPELAVKFLAYDEFKKIRLRQEGKHELTIFDRIINAALAGILSHTVVFPLEVIKTKIVMQQKRNVIGIYGTILNGINKYGWKFLFQGFVPSILGIAMFSSVDLTTYEVLKKFYLEEISTNNKLTSSAVSICGFSSAIMANFFSFPFSLVSTYLQFIDMHEMNSIQMARVFIKERWTKYGILGLYKGFYLTSLKIVPSVSITYVVYEHILNILGTEMS